MITLGEKIKKLRNDKGLTLDELAKVTSSSKSYIWELENKSISKPSAEKLIKIANILGVTTEYLMGKEKKNTLVEAKDDAFINKYKSLKPEEKEKYIKLVELFETKE
jgi:transcriptional regulator with XRE-family HTH domain